MERETNLIVVLRQPLDLLESQRAGDELDTRVAVSYSVRLRRPSSAQIGRTVVPLCAV